MKSILELSATQIARAINSRTVSVSNVASCFIEQINATHSKINAIQQVNPEKLLEEASVADKNRDNSSAQGKLYGVPISIKDTCHVKDFIVSKGCKTLYGAPSTYDATVVARLKAEGAIIFGLTNTPELCLSYETDNLLYGRSNNPYNVSRTPGGSSGGQAAIIAAGGVPIGIGTDAGGSIRQPAHYCGICAHKPTQGLTPSTGNFPFDGAGIGAQLLTFGPMARYVEDLVLMMQIISGEDQVDPHIARTHFKNPSNTDLKSIRIAYFINNPIGSDPTNETVQAIEDVVQLLRAEVYSVKESYPVFFKDVYRLHYETFMLGGDGGQSLLKNFGTLNRDQLSPLTQQFLSNAEKCIFSTGELRQRFGEIERFRFAMMRFMGDYDVIVSPVTATPAHFHGETYANIHDIGYVIAHNLTGWPATVVPCGYSKEGLPIGVQIASKPWNDHLCLAIAQKIQSILGVFPIPIIK